jgi:CRP-like cAMP-binding protein
MYLAMIRKSDCLDCIESKDSIFNILSAEEKEILIKNHSCSYYKKGEIIYKEGDKPTGLICLSKGKVKVFKEGVGGREQIVRLAKTLGFIGYRALFASDNYISSAVALEDSVICIIDKESIFKVIRSNGELGLRIIHELAEELGFSNARTVSLTQKHIRGRLAESIIFLKETYGLEEDNSTIKVYLSREDLANLSNMTTSNAIRTLSTFASEGVISIDGRKIKIENHSLLQKISELG